MKLKNNIKAVELINISKIYSQGIYANKDINLDVEYGEIHAILGENGAGKSTLMKTLFGMHQPTMGTIKVNGEVVKISSPNVATDLQIGMVHQHFQLINNFSVLDNIILGYELKDKSKVNQINYLFSRYLSYIDKMEEWKIAKVKNDIFTYKKAKLESKIFYRSKKIDYLVAKKLKKINDWYNKNVNLISNAQEKAELDKKHQENLEEFNIFNKVMGYELEKLDYKLSNEIKKISEQYNNNEVNLLVDDVIINTKIFKIKKRMNFYRNYLHKIKRMLQMRFWLNTKVAKKRIEELCKQMNFDLNLKEKVRNVSVFQQQKIEILKVLYRDAKILILDEPTAILTPQEIDNLMKMLLEFKNQNKAVIIITHKLNEIKRMADRCTIIRQGNYIDTVDVKKATINDLAQLMVGRKVNLKLKKSPLKKIKPLLVMKDINTYNNKLQILKNFSFEINAGEILGIAGIEGNGQLDIVNVICGYLKPFNGQIDFYGNLKIIDKVKNKFKEITQQKVNDLNINASLGQYVSWKFNLLNLTPQDIYNLGVHLIPADRQKEGLVLEMNLWENIALRDQFNHKYNNFGLLKISKIKNKTQNLINKFDIRGVNSLDNKLLSLSGGNQQKVIISRELSEEPKLIIAISPTRGMDVGAIEYIYQSLLKEREKGNAVLLISYELDEIINLSDRVLTISNGKNMGILDEKDITKEKIGLMMGGLIKNE